MFEYAWFILLLPILAFVLIGLAGRRLPEGGGHIAIGAVGGSLALSAYLFYQVLALGAVGNPVSVDLRASIPWIPGPVPIEMGLLVDNLTAVLLLLVSFLSFLILVYSLGYMHAEEGKPRYYAEMALFVAGMLGTVSADNFLQLLIFWEIMGLCSYLLIGFWYSKPSAAKAAKKAFLVTRIGDVLFLVGIFVIWNLFGTFRFDEIQAQIPSLYPIVLTPALLAVIPLLLFGGAMGKSAQFPLHAWLPDAMEGPTTVSALIHAATMVNAGVYLVARSFIFLVPPQGTSVAPPWIAIVFIAAIGAFTAIFAATMALVNYDIKRVLAFSTISQLGYMFLGLGAGAYIMATAVVHGNELDPTGYSAALFHLVNNGFAKALLFLCAGSVIHVVHTNDMREMGGLRNAMPITAVTMLFGALALSGIPPFSGFFSKGLILSVSLEAGAEDPWFYLFYFFAIATSFLTAFYLFRLWYMTFRGTYRGQGHPHESPRVMTVPLMMLAFFALFSGLFAYAVSGFSNLIFFERPEAALPLVGLPAMEYALEALAVVLALAGIAVAWTVYVTRRIPAERFTSRPAGAFAHRMLSNRYWIDDAYDAFGARAVAGLAKILDWFDRYVIDGIVNAVGRGGMVTASGTDSFDRRVVDGAVNVVSSSTVRGALRLRQRQTGLVQGYAWVVVVGLALVIALMFGIAWYLRAARGG